MGTFGTRSGNAFCPGRGSGNTGGRSGNSQHYRQASPWFGGQYAYSGGVGNKSSPTVGSCDAPGYVYASGYTGKSGLVTGTRSIYRGARGRTAGFRGSRHG